MELLKLFWVKPLQRNLMVVAASNAHQASVLLDVHSHTIKRSGGVWVVNHDNPEAPQALSLIYDEAIQSPGIVYFYTGQWRRERRHAHRIPKPIRQSHKDNSPRPYTLRFTHEEYRAFKKAGGGPWLRKEIIEAQATDGVQPSRANEAAPRATSVRMQPSLWERYQFLGGKTWLLIRLPGVGKE